MLSIATCDCPFAASASASVRYTSLYLHPNLYLATAMRWSTTASVDSSSCYSWLAHVLQPSTGLLLPMEAWEKFHKGCFDCLDRTWPDASTQAGFKASVGEVEEEELVECPSPSLAAPGPPPAAAAAASIAGIAAPAAPAMGGRAVPPARAALPGPAAATRARSAGTGAAMTALQPTRAALPAVAAPRRVLRQLLLPATGLSLSPGYLHVYWSSRESNQEGKQQTSVVEQQQQHKQQLLQEQSSEHQQQQEQWRQQEDLQGKSQQQERSGEGPSAVSSYGAVSSGLRGSPSQHLAEDFQGQQDQRGLKEDHHHQQQHAQQQQQQARAMQPYAAAGQEGFLEGFLLLQARGLVWLEQQMLNRGGANLKLERDLENAVWKASSKQQQKGRQEEEEVRRKQQQQQQQQRVRLEEGLGKHQQRQRQEQQQPWPVNLKGAAAADSWQNGVEWPSGDPGELLHAAVKALEVERAADVSNWERDMCR